MSKTHKIICAGFGGQGVMSLGMTLMYSGMLDGKEVAWVPSYGPEMRGGTANCSVTVSDEPVSSPIFDAGVTILVAMNAPSLEKFLPKVAKGGSVFVNSSIITEKVDRDDVNVYYVPSNEIAGEIGNPKLINMVMMGAIIKAEGIVKEESVIEAIPKVLGEKAIKFLDVNKIAIEKGKAAI